MAHDDSSLHVALVATAVDGSARMWESLGPRFDEVAEVHSRILRHAAEERDGLVLCHDRREWLLAFDDPVAAMTFAVDVQQALDAYPWAPHLSYPLRLRIGLHWGRLNGRGQADSRDSARVQRLRDAGHGGQVLVTDALLEVFGDVVPPVSLTDLGAHRLNGSARTHRIYQVTLNTWRQQQWPALRGPE